MPNARDLQPHGGIVQQTVVWASDHFGTPAARRPEALPRLRSTRQFDETSRDHSLRAIPIGLVISALPGSISTDRASPSREVSCRPAAAESRHTTHFSETHSRGGRRPRRSGDLQQGAVDPELTRIRECSQGPPCPLTLGLTRKLRSLGYRANLQRPRPEYE